MARSITTRSTNPKIMDDNIKILDDALVSASTPPAEDVSYDNTDSGLTADDVQDAINELDENIKNLTDFRIVKGDKAYTIAASGTFNFNPTADITIPEGYTAIGILGFTTNSAQVLPISVSWNNSSWGVGVRNISTGEQTGTINLDILCIKTRS